MRLTHAKQIEVRSVQDHQSHCGPFVELVPAIPSARIHQPQSQSTGMLTNPTAATWRKCRHPHCVLQAVIRALRNQAEIKLA
jgi:hypothetical protein